MVRRTSLISLFMLLLNSVTALSDSYQWRHFQIDHAELSDFSRWQSVINKGDGCVSPRYSSVIKNSGNQSIRFSCTDNKEHGKSSYLTGAFWYKKGAVPGTIDPLYFRFDLYLDRDFVIPKTGDSIRIFTLASIVPVHLYLKKGPSGNIILYSGISGSTNITKGIWHSIEIKYASGSKVGELTVWFDNILELKLTNKNYGDVTRFDIGWVYAYSTASGSIYIDDIMWDDKRIGIPSGPRVDLIYPDFRGRVGVKVITLLSGWKHGDKVLATVSDAHGIISTPYNNSSVNSGKIIFPINLKNIPEGNYTLLVKLLTSDNSIKAEAQYYFIKPYYGDSVFSIDENNNIIKYGRKFFPVTDYGNLRDTSAQWIVDGYINMHYGQDWNSPSPSKWLLHVKYLWKEGLKTFTGGPDVNGFRGCMTKDQWLTYVNSTVGVQGIAYYSPMDEPHSVKGCGSDYGKQWFDAVKENDPGRMVHVNHAGRTELKDRWGRDWFWPRMTADIYSWDHYPVAYNGGDFSEFIEIAKRCNNWTYGLNPCMTYIQTTDIDSKNCTDAIPTDAQVKANAWEAVVLGHKGIHWYHWSCSRQNKFATMKKFVDDMKILQNAVLGEDANGIISFENVSGRIDAMVKYYEGKYYIFTVNTKNQLENTVKIQYSFLQANQNIYVYGENRSIKSNKGYFIDNFQGHNDGENPVHIYYFDRL